MSERLERLRSLVGAHLRQMPAPRARLALALEEVMDPPVIVSARLAPPGSVVRALQFRAALDADRATTEMAAEIKRRKDAVAVLVLSDDGVPIALLFAEHPDDLDRWELVEWSCPEVNRGDLP